MSSTEVRVHATFEVKDVDSFLAAAKLMVAATQVNIHQIFLNISKIFCPSLRLAVFIMNCLKRMVLKKDVLL